MDIKKVAIITSGGDVPGLNPCIRALTLLLTNLGCETYGIRRGNEGFIDGDIHILKNEDVASIINKGGTILKSSRSSRFTEKVYREQAYQNLKKHNIDALIAIGGDGSLTGMKVFSSEFDLPVIGIPKTIDNDILGTDFALGFDTSLNNAMNSIEKIRDTSESHDRIYFVEMMGRDAGFLSLSAAIASGSTEVFLPEVKGNKEKLAAKLKIAESHGGESMIILVAEGDESSGAESLCKEMKLLYPKLNMTYTILGHIQRGGQPTAFDRILAARYAYKAVENIQQGIFDVMVGIQKNDIVNVPLQEIGNKHLELNNELLLIQQKLGEVL
jgi:6-phosphofructokinase 1